MYLNLIWPAVQLIEKGLASGKGFLGGSEYVGLAGIAHAYLHLSGSMAQISASHMASAPEPLQALAASHDSLLSMAAQLANAASTSPRVSELYCTLPHAVPIMFQVADSSLRPGGASTVGSYAAAKLHLSQAGCAPWTAKQCLVLSSQAAMQHSNSTDLGDWRCSM